MQAKEIRRFADRAPLAEGYRFELLKRSEVGLLIGLVALWFPDIAVGSASCYLREEFYERLAFFADGPSRDVLVMLLKQGEEPVGMFSCQCDMDTLSMNARLGVVEPAHRGSNLVQAGLVFVEALGRHSGLGYAYGMATMKAPYVQRAFERAGWLLSGITPGYDREMVAPGVVKRVYEALYTKVLVGDACLLPPQRQNLTPRTQAFFDSIFGAPESRELAMLEHHEATG